MTDEDAQLSSSKDTFKKSVGFSLLFPPKRSLKVWSFRVNLGKKVGWKEFVEGQQTNGKANEERKKSGSLHEDSKFY